MKLAEVDRAEILILVDNVTDGLSSTPKFVETEMSRLARRGIAVLGGECLCCAAHGLSCLVTLHQGSGTRTLLFDTGPDAEVFARNAQRLGADLGKVDEIVLSHGHWDHGGGLLRALDLIRGQGGARTVPFHAHPDMFNQRSSKLPDGSFRIMEDLPTRQQLAAHGGRVIETREPELILDELAWVSGEIPRRTAYEKGLPGQHKRMPDGGWEPDEMLIDERAVAFNVKGKGLVVLSACSHAGVVNVLRHARQSFPSTPLHCVMGGLHLSGTNERIIPETVRDLGEFKLTTIAAGHCTGWRAMSALMNAFGDACLAPLAVGKTFSF
ncbi:MAG: MBL fold metallo-hydrolase [Proteobacteria bacterium]|nr:MBL fold metallo-hydrolase [Pseudomonadota bacterium]